MTPAPSRLTCSIRRNSWSVSRSVSEAVGSSRIRTASSERNAEAGEDRLGAPVQLALVEQAATGRLGAEEQILLDRHLRHQRELLEYRADAERARVMHRVQLDRRAAEGDPPGIGPQRAGGDRDQGRLAGTVLAEQDVHLARPQLEVDLVERQHTGEALGDRLEAEQGRAHSSGRAALLRRRGRHRPCAASLDREGRPEVVRRQG
jgi:hypothetical protein